MSVIRIIVIVVSIICLCCFAVFAVANPYAAFFFGLVFLAGCLYAYIMQKLFGKEKVVYIPCTAANPPSATNPQIAVNP